MDQFPVTELPEVLWAKQVLSRMAGEHRMKYGTNPNGYRYALIKALADGTSAHLIGRYPKRQLAHQAGYQIRARFTRNGMELPVKFYVIQEGKQYSLYCYSTYQHQVTIYNRYPVEGVIVPCATEDTLVDYEVNRLHPHLYDGLLADTVLALHNTAEWANIPADNNHK